MAHSDIESGISALSDVCETTDVKDPDPEADVKDPDPEADVKDPDPEADVKDPDPEADVKDPDPEANVKDPEPDIYQDHIKGTYIYSIIMYLKLMSDQCGLIQNVLFC